MSVRQATRRFADLPSFLSEYPSTLGVGALVLPSGAVDGEPAPEMKVDLVLPIAGRVGPLVGQVVSLLPDGGVALRVVDTPAAAKASMDQLLRIAEEVRGWLLATGQLVEPSARSVEADELARLQRRVWELEGRLAAGAAAPRSAEAPASAPAGAPRATGERGLALPDVADQLPTLSGDLADRSLRDAFIALAVEKQTGLFTLRRPDGRVRYGFWSKGGPVGWRTEPLEQDEVLGVLLYRGGTITKEQLAQSLEIMERTGGRQGDALIEMGVCTFPQLVLMLQKQVDFVFQRVLREREGTWTFHLLDELPERFLTPPVRVASILYRALLAHAKEMPAQDLAAALRPWLDHYVHLAPGVEPTFEEMKLSTHEQQFVQIIQRTPYRLREIFAVSSLSRSQTAATVWSMQDLNLLELRAQSSGVRERERFERDLAARRAASKAKTLFERLDVHWICTTDEVEAAYKRLKDEWSPKRLEPYGAEHGPVLEEINAALDEAYGVLRSESKRREYRIGVIERTKIEQSAELLARQGEMAVMKASGRDALTCFSKAVELVPNNAEYREGLNRARSIPR